MPQSFRTNIGLLLTNNKKIDLKEEQNKIHVANLHRANVVLWQNFRRKGYCFTYLLSLAQFPNSSFPEMYSVKSKNMIQTRRPEKILTFQLIFVN